MKKSREEPFEHQLPLQSAHRNTITLRTIPELIQYSPPESSSSCVFHANPI